MERPLPDSTARDDALSELLRRIRAWRQVPPLRMDLRFVRTRQAGLFRICDPTSQKFVELYELECLVAQQIDGQRTTRDLTEPPRVLRRLVVVSPADMAGLESIAVSSAVVPPCERLVRFATASSPGHRLWRAVARTE